MKLLWSRRERLGYGLLLLTLAYGSAYGEPVRPPPPNVLVFLMDDMGIGDCRVYNPECKVRLPNLEKLAETGMVFSDAHAPAAVCAPTRYSILTGNYPWRGRNENGTWLFHMPSQILPGQRTLGHLMREAGYHTAFLGKVHLGGTVYGKATGKPKRNFKDGFRDFDFSRKIEDSPASLGFDYAYELPQGIQGSPYLAFENGRLVGKESELRDWKKGTYENSVIEADGFGSPDWDSSKAGPILTQKALDYIRRHIARNRESSIRKPFFMHYCSQSCHVPHTPPIEIAGQRIKGTTPDYHLDMLVEADATLGLLIEELRRHGELENTLILFTSDNGGLARGPVGKPRWGHNSNAGLRGSKAQIYEGGHRVPFIASWGNGNSNSPIQPGSRSETLIGLQDLFATFSELTTQSMKVGDGLDSQSFLGTLLGEKKFTERSTLLVQANDGEYFNQQSKKALRENQWKLIATRELQAIELYDLASDPTETRNRIEEDEQSERIKRMSADLNSIFRSERSTAPYRLNGNDDLKKEPKVHANELKAPRANLLCKVLGVQGGKAQNWNQRWKISGTSPVRLTLIPRDSQKWDLSGFKLVGVPIQNWEKGIVTIEGRLNNGNLTSWSHHAVGFAVAPSWERVTLGFPFPMIEDRFEGSELFKGQLGKPNGHRLHWRRFYPEDTREITMDFRSSTGKVNLLVGSPFVAWPKTQPLEDSLMELPFLDELGQVRAVDWPGKTTDLQTGRKALTEEFAQASEQAKQKRLGKYGGWIDGPKLDSTGRFRTEKVDGKWWLIDPDGHLFFSVGACLTGWRAETSAEQKRAKNDFFAYLPQARDYLRWTGMRKLGGRDFVNFPGMNYQRYFGKEWSDIVSEGIHDRMRAWGLNTLGCWSDDKLQKDRKTPYVLISSIWWQANGHRKFPSPFRESFQSDLEKNLRKLSWAKNDPYCLGIFMGNELEWPDRIGPTIENLPPEHPTKKWALRELKKLGKPTTPAKLNDLESLYLPFVRSFFSKCKRAVEKELPGTLYLGCRTHRGPNVLGRGALGSVDVFSVNVYDSRVRSWQVPEDTDIPIISSEFHFGAVDRGVPSPGLSGSWDQRQRALSFAHYLSSALADPRFVGVHWFQWIDQSAAGRQDRENHQCGFIDVAGRSYPEFTEVVTQSTSRMYATRMKPGNSIEGILAELLGR